MLGFPSAVRVFVCREPADVRKSFDGLCALVVSKLNDSPTSGHVFIFRNRRSDSADVNQDGGVDGADVDYFFARWEAGGC